MKRYDPWPVLSHPPVDKPVLIYDGSCYFCRRCLLYLRRLLGRRMEYLPFQQAHPRFAELPLERMQQAVLYIDRQGRVCSGAHAILMALALAPGRGKGLYLYRHLPGFAWISERIYRFVSRHRPFFSRILILLSRKGKRG